MPSPRWVTLVILLALACTLGVFNIWTCAYRSTIPLELNGQVVKKEIRREKHPGHDDVFLLHLDDNRMLQVDQAVFDPVDEGATIRKQAWQRQLMVNETTVELVWSNDLRGMMKAMPLIIIVLIAAGGFTQSCKPQ